MVVGDLFVTGSIDGGNKGRLASRFSSADGLPPKPFDIKHPTKGKGWRLKLCLFRRALEGVFILEVDLKMKK